MVQFQKPELDELHGHQLLHMGNNCLRMWHAESTPDLTIMWARDHTHDYPLHLHDCAEIVFLHSGRVRVTCHNMSYDLKSGDICLFAPNELHSTQTISAHPFSFSLLHVPSRLYWKLIDEGANRGKAPVPLRILRAQEFNIPFNDYLEDVIHSISDDERINLVFHLLEMIMTTRDCIAPTRIERAFWHPAVIHARSVMSENCEETKNINSMAHDVGLNVRYFISLFKDGTGLSPHQYQIAMRVERARSLIQTLNAPLCDVAASTGFSDQSHLNRHFKRSYGFTPGAFRQILRFI